MIGLPQRFGGVFGMAAVIVHFAVNPPDTFLALRPRIERAWPPRSFAQQEPRLTRPPMVLGDVSERSGAAEGTRTPDPIITNDVLYQLSYSGHRALLLRRPAKVNWPRDHSQAMRRNEFRPLTDDANRGVRSTNAQRSRAFHRPRRKVFRACLPAHPSRWLRMPPCRRRPRPPRSPHPRPPAPAPIGACR